MQFIEEKMRFLSKTRAANTLLALFVARNVCSVTQSPVVKLYTMTSTKKSRESCAVFSTAFIGHHVCLLQVCTSVLVPAVVRVLNVSGCVRGTGTATYVLERVLSVSWNVALPPMLRWLPSSKMAARITLGQWETQRSETFSKRSSFFISLCSFFPSFLLSSVSPLLLSVDKRFFVGRQVCYCFFSVICGLVWLQGKCCWQESACCVIIQLVYKHLLQIMF